MPVKYITREEFFKIYPPETRCIRISSFDGKEDTVIPIGSELICDFCNEDIGEVVGMTENYALCDKCSKEISEKA